MRETGEEIAPAGGEPAGVGVNVVPAQGQPRNDVMASPRLIPVPDSPRHGGDVEHPLLENDENDPSASFV